MEYCEQGQLMKYNCDETGYEYNKKLIIFFLKKLLFENCFNQRNIIINFINFKKDQDRVILEKEIIENFRDLEAEIKEDTYKENYIFNLFDNNFKLKVFFCKIFLKQIIEAIKYLHSKNICNRDIKPENIVFKDTFNNETFDKNEFDYCFEKKNNLDFLKIIDFSISKIYKNKNVKIISLAGSDFFKAPEISNFEYFDPFKAEIYSIGVTMIYFLFKKFYKSKSIKQGNEEEKTMLLENIKKEDDKNEFARYNSKLKTMRSNSFLNRPRKSSIIYNNFKKVSAKECITDLEETKFLFEEIDEIEFYYYLKSFIHDNPEERINIEQC